MTDDEPSNGPVLRLFEVRAKPGCARQLIEKFAVTSAEVVRGEAGNLGYFFGQGMQADDDHVVFASIWRDLDAVTARFGEAWQTSFLPPGYEALIEECAVRHINVGAGWHVAMDSER